MSSYEVKCQKVVVYCESRYKGSGGEVEEHPFSRMKGGVFPKGAEHRFEESRARSPGSRSERAKLETD